MRPGERAILPVGFRLALVVILPATLLLAFLYRLDGTTPPGIEDTSQHGELVRFTELYFLDKPDGVVSIVNASTEQEITRLQRGEDGFMRSVMRGLARERMARGHGQAEPFQLGVWEDGLVSLIDPVTQRRVELSAFGPDNVAAFVRLLDHSPPSRSRLSAGAAPTT